MGVASTIPIGQPCCGRHRGPVDVQPPAHPQALGEGQQHVEAVAMKGRHGADLHEGRLAHGGARVPARDRPGGMGVQAVGGLGELQPGALGRPQEGIEEPARQRDVVVDDQQPVVGRGRVRGEQRVEVLELAALALGRGDDVDRVAAAQQFGACGGHERAGALDAHREHAPARRAPPGGRPQARPARRRAQIEPGVAGAQERAALAADRAAGAREEVLAGARAGRRGQRGAQAPQRVRAEHRAVHARPPRAVQQAAGEDAQLGGQRRRRALEHVEAAAGLAAAVGRRAQRAQARVVARAAMVERGAGDVADPPAGGLHARLPLLLVAVELARLVEGPHPLDRAAAHRHVGAPRVVAVAVGRRRGPGR